MKATIIRKRKRGITIQFMNNDISYMQDHYFPRGIPTDIEFFVEGEIKDDYIKLIAEGYGALHNNPYGLAHKYGNGALFVKKSHLVNSMLPGSE